MKKTIESTKIAEFASWVKKETDGETKKLIRVFADYDDGFGTTLVTARTCSGYGDDDDSYIRYGEEFTFGNYGCNPEEINGLIEPVRSALKELGLAESNTSFIDGYNGGFLPEDAYYCMELISDFEPKEDK